jgi:valyl-tRNA synthetase
VEKERKKAEKAAKLEAKKAKAAAAATAPVKEKKAKKEKVEEEPLPEYVAVESAWYSWWEKEGFFKPEFKADGNVKDEGSFVIVHPPPNVTGNLHMGHALGDSLQDLMIRWNRMHGKTTLWLPGCDHAGISTQSVVENMLWRRKQQTRHDLGREKFVETVWEWKEDYHKRINKALTSLGSSFDWSREGVYQSEQFECKILVTNVTQLSPWTLT